MVRPPIWKMISDAIINLGNKASYTEIKDYINTNWEDVKRDSITTEIIAVTVNHPSRIYYETETRPARLTNSNSNYDILFKTDRGQVEKYEPSRHGIWEIYQNSIGEYKMRESTPSSFLFCWNPKNWPFDKLEEKIDEINKTGKARTKWSVAGHKKIKPGDRAFLALVGSKHRGIFASGYVISESFLSPHWSENGKLVPRVLIEFEIILNPNTQKILEVQSLKNTISSFQNWSPQSSGIEIRSDVREKLELAWLEFLATENPIELYSQPAQIFIEGGNTQILQTVYERSKSAREACLKHHGYSCAVCKLDFKTKYGIIGENFIHVHHLTPVHVNGSEQRRINPIADLVPVCPNCHAMLHKNTPPFTIDDLKARMNPAP